jgi:hypothetical protein
MTSRRTRPAEYREPRPRKEVAFAVLCAVAVVVLTVLLILVLQP